MIDFLPSNSIEDDVHEILNKCIAYGLSPENFWNCSSIASDLEKTQRYPKRVLIHHKKFISSQLIIFVQEIMFRYWFRTKHFKNSLIHLFPKLKRYINLYVQSYFLKYKNSALKVLWAKITIQKETIPFNYLKNITYVLYDSYRPDEIKYILTNHYSCAYFSCTGYPSRGFTKKYPIDYQTFDDDYARLKQKFKHVDILFKINTVGISKHIIDYLKPSNWFLDKILSTSTQV